jgi:hypothetical protein
MQHKKDNDQVSALAFTAAVYVVPFANSTEFSFGLVSKVSKNVKDPCTFVDFSGLGPTI